MSEAKGWEAIEECLRLLKRGELREARELVKRLPNGHSKGEKMGRRLALQGILHLLSSKHHLSEDELEGIRETMLKKRGGAWSDEFDKGYQEVWLKWFELLEGCPLDRLGKGDEGIVESPREEEEEDIAPHPGGK